ncbi:hypothetical protein D1007_46755 [Hordeum vulgare]|nr:hypothetical protein D1007_46755 [Hordeum vulgare]
MVPPAVTSAIPPPGFAFGTASTAMIAPGQKRKKKCKKKKTSVANGQNQLHHRDTSLVATATSQSVMAIAPQPNPPSTTGMGYDEVTEEHVLVTLANAGHGSSAAMECHLWRLKEDMGRIVRSPFSIRVRLDLPPIYVDGKMYWMGDPPPDQDSLVRSPFSIRVRLDLPPIYVDGKMYWMGDPPPDQDSQSSHSCHGMIMALDIHTESFEVCAHTETMTIWSKNNKPELVDNKCNDEGCEQEWTREHVIELWRWPGFSPKTAAGLIVPVEVDAMGGGQILLDTGSEVGLYDPSEQTMHTVYSLNWPYGEHTDKFVATALWEDSMVPPPPMRCEPERWYRDV